MPNAISNSKSNKPLRDHIRAGKFKAKGKDLSERIQNLFIQAAERYPKSPIPVRYIYKAVNGGRLPTSRKGEECKLIKKEIRKLRAKSWSHKSMPLVYVYGAADSDGYRLCIDEDDKIQEVLDPKIRQVDTRTQAIGQIVSEINPRKVKEDANLEKLDRGQVIANQLLLPEGDMEVLMKNAERARNRLLLKSANTSTRKAAKKTAPTPTIKRGRGRPRKS